MRLDSIGLRHVINHLLVCLLTYLLIKTQLMGEGQAFHCFTLSVPSLYTVDRRQCRGSLDVSVRSGSLFMRA